MPSPVTPAPVGIYACDRPRLLEQVLLALERCDGFTGHRAHVFCDAPRSAEHAARVEETIEVARSWCQRANGRLVVRPENRGLSSLTDGMTELCEAHGAAISIEDDHLVAPGFLAFIDRALARFAGDERVFQVCGYRVGPPWEAGPDAFFLKMPMPTGWATWRRAWRHFQWDAPGAEALLRDPGARHAFDAGGAYPASTLLSRALRGTFDSYFIRWYYAIFRAGGLTLCPRRSLVKNVGLGSGVHGRGHVAPERESFFNGAFAPEDDARATAGWNLPDRAEVDPDIEARVRAILTGWTRAAR